MLVVSCGPMQPSRPPAAAPALKTPESQPAETPAPAPAPEPAAAPSPTPEPVASPATATARALCEGVCERVAEKCSESVAETCRLNCDQYDRTPKPCERVAREALVCAEGASDLPCANVAPESCGKQFRRMAQCQRSPDTFQASAEEAKAGLPAGWERYADDAFSVAMPKGVVKSRSGAETLWSVKVGSVRYAVRKLPAPAEKLTAKSQVRLATEWLKPCNSKLKLHGQVERGDRISMHYDVGCKDGSERHGMIHLTPQALFIVGIEAPAGERGEIDAFIYDFTLQ